ncbi:MAG: hypothetical protein JXA95_16915 [Spirochaetales bacterium]|nr:hypothetical protein [Spirochaetales bacterium]
MTVLAISIFIILTTGCFLASADNGSSYLSVSASSSDLRGFYGDVGDVQYIDVYVYRDPDRTVDSEESGSTDDELLAHHVLNSGNGWSTTFMDVPTLTTLRIEAYAKGNPNHDYTNEIGWNPVENTGESDVIMFDGNSYLYLTAATASVFLSMRQYNDGFLERFPRLNHITTDLDARSETDTNASLKFDFNSYGEVTWADDSTSYETWYWRIVETDSSRADSAFSIYTVDGVEPSAGESTFPEGAYRFDEINSADDYGDNLILNYLFPNYDGDIEVDWYQHGYVLEIVNPQHNVLRQQFVINPGTETDLGFNFAPFIRNITAQRSFPYLDGVDQVTFSGDVVDAEGGTIRYLWLTDLNIPYNAVAGDIIPGQGAACLADSEAMITALNTPSSESDLNSSDYLAFYALASQYIVSSADYGTATDNNLFDTAGSVLKDADGNPMELPVKEKLIIPGPVFDSSPDYTGELYLVVFDEVWGTSDDLDTANTIYQKHEDALTFIKMSLNQDSFPNTSTGGSGLFVFE